MSSASPISRSDFRHCAGNFVMGGLLAMLGSLAYYYQSGSFSSAPAGAERLLWALVATLVYIVLSVPALLRWSRGIGAASRRVAKAGEVSVDDRVLVVHASQTGNASQLAAQTADSLRAGGLVVDLFALQDVDARHLSQASRALFVASTTGEGDAPDGAAQFVRTVMDSSLRLDQLSYGVLALGDREYANFCGFGHALDDWLERAGAQRLFDTVMVDDGDAGSLRYWQYRLGQLSGRSDLPDWQIPRYSPWRLVERSLVNPGSQGDPCFRVSLRPLDRTQLNWQAGDVAEIGPQNAPAAVEAWLARNEFDGDSPVLVRMKPWTLRKLVACSALDVERNGRTPQQMADALVRLPHRDYSIASIASDGQMDLLLRQWRRSDGSFGLGTGWLTEYAEPGAELSVRVRSNAAFHAPTDDVPVILIGNGTGIASLRALLKQRIANGRHRNWLIFGERNADRDFHFRDEILAWQATQGIERLDLAFSRDQAERIHVQHRLQSAAAEVRSWVADGAFIYVCGSSQGMAPGVDAALRRILGDATVHDLTVSTRYRRDVY